MKKQILLTAGLLIAGHASAAEFLVKYKDSSASRVSIMNMRGFRVMDEHDQANLIKVNIDARNVVRVLKSLYMSGNVEYVVPNVKLHTFESGFDMAGLQDQWANTKVNAEKAWQLAGNRGSRNVIVAVIDTGVDYNHPALKDNAISGYDFRDNDSDPMDLTGAQNPGHGTHCAGSIGASGLADGGVQGLSPEVSIMPLRFLGADGSGDLMAGIKAIDMAIEKKADVISASWGATIDRAQAQPLVDAVKRASDAGVIMVMAAANDGRSNDSTEVYPANADFPNTITVAASGPQDEKPQWSNYGKATVHVASPGLNIMSTLPGNKYGNLSGTSMATPLVAGLVALLKAQQPDLTGLEIRALLQTTGAKVDIETACNCRVDAGAAMETLLQKKPFVAPAALTLFKSEATTAQFDFVNAARPLQFESTNASVATIDAASGLLTAVAPGETTIKVTDANGLSATTMAINVFEQREAGGGGGGDCPLGDPALCQIMCGIMPSLPWCQ
jgi:thermitase